MIKTSRSDSFLFAISFAVHAARPAARPTYAFSEFCVGSLDAPLSGFDQFGAFYPADPLVARKWGDVVPGRQCSTVSYQRFSQVSW